MPKQPVRTQRASDAPKAHAAPPSEERFVAWLRRATRAGRAASAIGDDTATLPPPKAGHALVVTVDQQIEGTHFASGTDLATVGRRLLRVNLSDLAASGATPRWALLALGLPAEVDPRPLVRALVADARAFGVTLVGGDVGRSLLLSASLTLAGEKSTRAASLGRDRARAGHRLWLGGTVGESALGCELLLRNDEDESPSEQEQEAEEVEAGNGGTRSKEAKSLPRRERLRAHARRALRRNLLPTPQLELGRWLAGLGSRAGACIDVSDGLAKDLRRICSASGVGAELDLRRLRGAVPPRFEQLAEALGLDPVAVALAGGEDYVLLFTLPASIEPPARFGCVEIGRIVAGRALRLLDREGRRHSLPNLGWDHLAPAAGDQEEEDEEAGPTA